VKLQIDTARCAGHGRCYTLVPELFEDDEQGFGVVRGTGVLTSDDVAAAERAVGACPEQAIGLERDDQPRPETAESPL
jgi:ferredoxin